MILEIRKATLIDCQDIFKWRTDPINSEGSFTGGEFCYEDHKNWFMAYLKRKDNLMLLASFNGKPCCVLRFDGTILSRVVSIYMVPGFHGLGLGLQCLLLGERFLIEEAMRVKSLTAEISHDNRTSKRLFRAAGYICENNADTSSDWYKVI